MPACALGPLPSAEHIAGHLLGVVVVALDGFLYPHAAAHEVLQAAPGAVHHLVAIEQSELLCPPQIPQVRPELRLALDEVGEVYVGQADPPALALLLRDLDVPDCEFVTDAARSGVREKPHAVLLVKADFDEVVPRPEAAELEPPVRGDLLGAVGAVARLQGGDQARKAEPVADLVVVLACRQRDGFLDRLPQAAERRRIGPSQVLAGQLRTGSHHPAADIDSDSSGHDRAQGRDDRADRRALAEMAVAHQRHVRPHERHRRCPLSLFPCLRLQDRRPAHQLLRDLLHCLFLLFLASCLRLYSCPSARTGGGFAPGLQARQRTWARGRRAASSRWTARSHASVSSAMPETAADTSTVIVVIMGASRRASAAPPPRCGPPRAVRTGCPRDARERRDPGRRVPLPRPWSRTGGSTSATGRCGPLPRLPASPGRRGG